MSLRIGVDLDGTLADLSSMYHAYEKRLFGDIERSDDDAANETNVPAETDRKSTDRPTERERLRIGKEHRMRQEAIWRAILETPDFWTTLNPIEPSAVRDLQAAALSNNWEVFFITQRPKCAGASVQMQSQRWLVSNGFQCPSVLTVSGSRGKAVYALDLDFLIDDLPKNCVDVISDSKCRPILLLRDENQSAESTARRMGIGVVRSVAEAIELLSRPATGRRESIVDHVRRALGLTR